MNTPTSTNPAHAAADGGGVSVWLAGQRPASAQRAGRYVPDTARHPARMLPDLAAHAITTLTAPGELVFDPLCGVGTTLVEAMHLGRPAVGVELEPRWATVARANIDRTRRSGIGGHAHVLTADAQGLPDLLPPQFVEQMLGRVRLLLTAWPSNPHTHGHTPARTANLAHQPAERQLAGMTAILRGCLPLLAPDATVVVTARPWREHGELLDLPTAITRAGIQAGLQPVQRCVAVHAGIRDGQIITRASRFHRVMIARARDNGAPWHLGSHEDIVLFRAAPAGRRRARRTAHRMARHAQTLASGPHLGRVADEPSTPPTPHPVSAAPHAIEDTVEFPIPTSVTSPNASSTIQRQANDGMAPTQKDA